jgi:hypothetical protein
MTRERVCFGHKPLPHFVRSTERLCKPELLDIFIQWIIMRSNNFHTRKTEGVWGISTVLSKVSGDFDGFTFGRAPAIITAVRTSIAFAPQLGFPPRLVCTGSKSPLTAHQQPRITSHSHRWLIPSTHIQNELRR